MKKKKVTRKKYSTGTAVKNYMENPYTELQQNRINNVKADSEASNSGLVQGLGVAGNLLMQVGLSQGSFGEGAGGQFADAALPILGNMEFANGGRVPVEVEGGEVAETPQGELLDFDGPGHENGGIDADLEPGTEIFSDRIKIKGKSMADRKVKRERKEMTLEKLLSKNPTDALTKNAQKRTKETHAIQENFDKSVQEIVSSIEQLQQQFAYGGEVENYANGGTVDPDPPTKRAKLLARLQSLNIAMDHTADSFQNLQEADVQGFLNQMFDENPNIKRPAAGKAELIKLMNKGDHPEVKTVSKTKFQIGEDPVAQEIVPGATRDEIFAKTRKELQEQGADPNTGTFEFNGKIFSTALSPTGGSSKDRLPDKVIETGEAEKVLDADKYFDNKEEFANGGYIGDPNKKNYSTFEDRPPLYDDAEYDPFKIDFSNIQMTDSLPGADPMIADQYTNSYSGLPEQRGKEVTDANGKLLPKSGGFDFNDPSTLGDKIGLAGNLYSMFAGINNTKEAFGQSTPNVNAFEDYGKEGLETLQGAKGTLDQSKARQLKALMLSKNALTKRGRNSARGVNQMRALDLASNMQGDLAANDVNNSYDAQMMQLLMQEAGMENQQDQVVMGGEGARDLADRQDLANYYTQRGRDRATIGQGLQETGKDLNAVKQNKVIMNLLGQLSKYGITIDAEGNVTTKDNG